jgi:ubiquitin-protein ligase
MHAVSPAQQRQIRLRNDFKTMESIRRPWLQWKSLRGAEPAVEKYEITLRLRTIVGPAPTYRDQHVLHLEVSPDHPRHAPTIYMITRPQPYHVNWFADGRWCYGSWLVYESLGAHVIRMIQTLQFNGEITNARSPANSAAGTWYVANLNRGLFPCDTTPLPDASAPQKKKFEIR